MAVGQNPWDPILEFTTHFRTYSGWLKSDVHWLTDLDFDPLVSMSAQAHEEGQLPELREQESRKGNRRRNLHKGLFGECLKREHSGGTSPIFILSSPNLSRKNSGNPKTSGNPGKTAGV